MRAAKQVFEEGPNSFAPAGCVDGITLSCATNLDGVAGAEVLAEITYRVYQPDCATARRNQVSPTRAIVVLSPPGPGSAGFRARGLIGYRSLDALGVESGVYVDVRGFVRLPSGDAAVQTRQSVDAGDCGGGRSDQILLLREDRFIPVARREITACNEVGEPEEDDPF